MRVKQKFVVRVLSDEPYQQNENRRSPEPVERNGSNGVPYMNISAPTQRTDGRFLLFRMCSNRIIYYCKGHKIRNKGTRNDWYKGLLHGEKNWNVVFHQIDCTMMDPVTKLKQNGEPLDPVPPHRWATNVICGEGDNLRMAQITGPNKGYLFVGSPSTSSTDDDSSALYDEASSSIPSVPSVVPSSDENAPVQSTSDATENSPPRKKGKYSKSTTVKSSSGRSRNTDPKNDSHVGEQTPHTSGKNATISRVPSREGSTNTVCMRVNAAFSPQPIRVRDIPLPSISWSDSTELSLLMCFKEDIGLTERSQTVFRRHPNLNTRMRAILFDWLMEVCDVYKLRRVTYYLAIDYIDRYLSRTDVIPKNHLQLLGITCLFIAAKVEEIYPPKLAELAYVTDGACTDTDMLAKEMAILTELHWDVNPMTVTGWLCLYLQLASIRGDKIRDMAHRMNTKDDDVIYPQFSPHLFMTASMLLDLCSLDDGMLQFKYSVIAASVVYFVLNREKALFVSGYNWDNIKLCVEWLDPFAMVVYRALNMRPLLAPREYVRSGSALRVLNPSIVLDEGHTLQNHVIDLTMLEDVYTEINIMRRNYKAGTIAEATGWTASDASGFDPSCVTTNPPKRKARRKHYRTSSYAQAIARNDSRVYVNSKDEPPVEVPSESDDEQQNKFDQIKYAEAATGDSRVYGKSKYDPPVENQWEFKDEEEKRFYQKKYAEAIARGDSRVYINPPVEILSESNNDQRKKLNQNSEGVPSVSGISPLQNNNQNDRLTQSSSIEASSSPLSTGSMEYDPYPYPPQMHIRFIDAAGNRIDRIIRTDETDDPREGTSKQTNPIQNKGQQQNGNNQNSHDSGHSSDSGSGSDQSRGSKRRREEITERHDTNKGGKKNDESKEPPRKKSCCDRKSRCGSMLASPKCSGLYLKEGEEACFGLRMTNPDQPVLPPEPQHPARPDKIKNERADGIECGGGDL